ncbi:LysR family transcriptional regulator [Mesorhizobium sp.]|uniref:LysR family transcriptional regulator n=1 Tax=Mesorhizobium sp. TaxID=1871066 RepID=UPI000FEA9542|nr:LysR family transcriptional regulator [Mesorhizobium sp.]RWK63433.1 MAG: LysR family transcriptional regulator [Mesorhizobium sp.]RWM51372.1 MAG: LysR family transcriptional regulator [Mesorhizobium sp.]RWM59714.1 MAG: LysR family transcriptional regulator [Mesorhizobium sp.]RWM60310.1 MAG: LysR family transcriptional regulator [Mesorhizobium sp.]RWN03214.1 MAG: LysR family transcriptional regulator [Mesorhizobium sp.]
MNLNRLAYFAAVVDSGSFTRAAERLGITKAVVSQQVARLERDLGMTLLIRTTRRVHPTEAGRTFHARCLKILQQAEDAFDELAQAAAEPTGTLRIAAPNDYGTSAVVPVIAAFSARYPACRVELTLGDETIDLASGGMDVAIRVGWLADSSLQARRIGIFRQFMVCGADFAGRFTAGEPQDLAGLPFVANMALREPLLWQFSRDNDEQAVRMQATIAIDATPAVLAAVRAGAGLSVLPDFLVRDELTAGRLVQILPEWRLPSGGIYTVYPAARFRPPKVTRFVEMLVAAEQKTGPVGEGRGG